MAGVRPMATVCISSRKGTLAPASPYARITSTGKSRDRTRAAMHQAPEGRAPDGRPRRKARTTMNVDCQRPSPPGLAGVASTHAVRGWRWLVMRPGPPAVPRPTPGDRCGCLAPTLHDGIFRSTCLPATSPWTTRSSTRACPVPATSTILRQRDHRRRLHLRLAARPGDDLPDRCRHGRPTGSRACTSMATASHHEGQRLLPAWPRRADRSWHFRPVSR